MFALYRMVEVPNGKRRRARLSSIYNTEEELFAFLDEQEDIADLKVELMNDETQVTKISAKKVREIIIRNKLTELGYNRHDYCGVLFDGKSIIHVPGENVTEDYKVPENYTFGLITYRYGIEDGSVILETINSRVADSDSIHNTLRRERENQELASGGFTSNIVEETNKEAMEEVLESD